MCARRRAAYICVPPPRRHHNCVCVQAELALQVQGVARVPADNSVHGSIVRIVTVAGTITLDDTVVVFRWVRVRVFCREHKKESTHDCACVREHAVDVHCLLLHSSRYQPRYLVMSRRLATSPFGPVHATQSHSTEMADIFTEAGFKVARNRRMLIGVYEVLGELTLASMLCSL